MNRRHFLNTGLAALPALSIAGRTQAQTYPSRPIRWINPFPAGSPMDSAVRRLAEMAAPKIGQPIVVENKPGANGSIGTAEIARAAPDGYTFGAAIADSLISVAALIKSPGYEWRRDLQPVVQVMQSQPLLFASSQLGASSLPQLVAAAKAKPGSIAYGSWGSGTLPHLVMASIERQTGASFLHVPYKGLAPIMQDLLGGSVQLTVGPPAFVTPHMKQGKVVPIGMLGPQRSPFMPELATMAEQGVDAPYLRNVFWMGIVAPKGLPANLLDRWVDVLGGIIRSPEYGRFLAESGGQEARFKEPAVFARDIATEYDVTMELIRNLGITPQ